MKLRLPSGRIFQSSLVCHTSLPHRYIILLHIVKKEQVRERAYGLENLYKPEKRHWANTPQTSLPARTTELDRVHILSQSVLLWLYGRDVTLTFLLIGHISSSQLKMANIFNGFGCISMFEAGLTTCRHIAVLALFGIIRECMRTSNPAWNNSCMAGWNVDRLNRFLWYLPLISSVCVIAVFKLNPFGWVGLPIDDNAGVHVV